MFKWFEKTNSALNLFLSLIAFATFTIGGFVGYQSVLSNVDENKTQIELTQIMFLKNAVKVSEVKRCIISDIEWDDYIYNYSKLYELKKKHKMISSATPWRPMERERKIKCD